MLPGIEVRSLRPPLKAYHRADASGAYNGPVANIPKVPKDQFEAVIKALLNTPPMPMAEITRKRQKAKSRAVNPKKKRG
jgi:hypothetical protein